MLATARDHYIEYLKTQRGRSIFAEPWWLDATCGAGGWDAFRFNDSPQNAAFIPYQTSSIRGMKAITTPPLSQYLPILKTEPNTPVKLETFLEGLSKFSILDITLKPEDDLQYDQSSVKVNLKYSYIISSALIDNVRSAYNEGLRRNLKEAEKKYVVEETADVETFIRLCQSTYQQRDLEVPSRILKVIPEIFRAISKHGRGEMKVAKYNDQPVAGIMTAFDTTTTYYLIGGRSVNEGGASAHALLLDDAIMHACNSGRSFDFEGSMNPGIANFFQSFGANPEAFWRFRKYRGLGRAWSLFQK